MSVRQSLPPEKEPEQPSYRIALCLVATPARRSVCTLWEPTPTVPKNLGETGILLEILLANKRRNPYASFPVFDSVIWEKVHFQENLESFLNTNMDDVILEGKKIKAVVCHQNSTETEYTIYGDIFVDATGHGTLATMCGATGRMGSEGRDEFKEPDAPEEPNSDTMGNTLLFSAVDRGEPVKFVCPEWANHYTEEDLKYREHANSIASHMEGGKLTKFEEGSGRLPHFPMWTPDIGGLNWVVRMKILSVTVRKSVMNC